MSSASASRRGRAWARAAVAILALAVVAVLVVLPYDDDGDLLWPFLFSLLEGQPIGQQVFYGTLFVLGLLFPVIFSVELYLFRRPFGWKSRMLAILQAGLAALAVFSVHFAATFRVIFTETTRPPFDIFIALSFVLCVWSLILAIVPNRASGITAYPFSERRGKVEA
jgi:uncharacterized membrane protein YidH (DUF202 family)